MTSHEKNKLEIMAEEIEDIKANLADLKEMIKDVHTLLAGNSSFPDQHGLVEDYNITKNKVDSLENDLKKYKSYFYALVTLVGLGILNFLKDLLSK
jgi:vacuolar-type H+-ATPase subunit I/STV1